MSTDFSTRLCHHNYTPSIVRILFVFYVVILLLWAILGGISAKTPVPLLRWLYPIIKKGLGDIFHLVSVPMVDLSRWGFVTIVMPTVRPIYINGPPLPMGYGFWNGLGDSEICATLAPSTKSSFWDDHPLECQAIIDGRVVSFIIGMVILVLACVVLPLLCSYVIEVVLVRPAVRMVQIYKATGRITLTPPSSWATKRHKHSA